MQRFAFLDILCCYQQEKIYFTKKDLGVFFNILLGYMEDINFTPKNPKFNCDKCNFISRNKKDYMRHILTPKHQKQQKGYFSNEKNPTPVCFDCLCGKKYIYQSGLWRHQQKCKCIDPGSLFSTTTILQKNTTENMSVHNNNNNSIAIYDELQPSNTIISELLKEIVISNKQNVEFKQLIVEQQSKIIELSNKPTSTTTNNNTISNSNININMFLNEHCKNAMTIDDFANSIQISIDDIMYMTQKGSREGLSAILTNAFNQLLITERPVHCTDVKRHTTYIKDISGWNKETDQSRLNKLCRNAEHKCIKKTLDIIEEDPNYTKIGTPEYECALKMMTEVNGGSAGSEYNHTMVIKTLEEKVGLDKQLMINTIPK